MDTRLAEIIAKSPETLTGRQIRAARIFSGVSQAQLAKKMGISIKRLIDAEAVGDKPIDLRPQRATVISLVTIFCELGVRFLEHEGMCRVD